jgi:hypothetical protein
MNPSAGATGGHIHVQFNSAAAAQNFSSALSSGGQGGGDVNQHNTTTITVAPGPTAEATAQAVGKTQKDVNAMNTRHLMSNMR